MTGAPYVRITNLRSLSNEDGGHPLFGVLEGLDGRLYGHSWKNGPNAGGDYEPGSLWSMARNGSDFRVEHAFSIYTNERNEDGYQPAGALTQMADGWIFGTTSKGGINGCGAAVKFHPSDPIATFKKDLHYFGSLRRHRDGVSPYGQLVPDGDGFVAAVSHGGNNGTGVLIRMGVDGSVSPMYEFPAITNTTVALPYGSPIRGGDGRLYGVALYGGSYGNGGIYAYDVISKVLEIVHVFEARVWTGNTDNTPPSQLIRGKDGHLYGTHLFAGRNGSGVVFALRGGVYFELEPMDPATTQTIPRYENATGAQPLSTLCEGRDGHLYGTCFYGGENGTGGIYQLTKDGLDFVLLYSFEAGLKNERGSHAYGGLIQSKADGMFYGTTFHGGVPGYGVVFRMEPPLSFAHLFKVEPSTVYTSQTIRLACLPLKKTISVVGGEYSRNGGAWTSVAGDVAVGDTLAVRVMSSPVSKERRLVTTTFGGVLTGSFGVTTR